MQKALTNLSKEEKGRYWSDLVQKWEKTGEDKTAFCRNQAINYDLFMYYSRRYTSNKVGSSLIPVKLTSSLSAYELNFPSGVVLNFSATTPLSEIIKLVREAT